MGTVLLDLDTCESLANNQARTYEDRHFASDYRPVTHSVKDLEQSASGIASTWWVSRVFDEDKFTGICWVDPELEVFKAHFPGNPILPGVVQIDWAVDAVKSVFSEAGDTHFIGMSRIKFKNPVAPGAWLRLELKRKEVDQKVEVSFVFTCTDLQVTQGKVHFGK